ncbi:hypothetical protein VTL71DRAFT_15730 [Oculimacula yallundae]|uniref:Uncharacterized protein n=1 Tax=Oculimacula yallundae TaxID=86028 RepID=A0ABR4CCJ5_9HELO
MPYERQLEKIWLRLQDHSAPKPRHAISTRLAFDDVCAAFMQAEMGPDVDDGGVGKPWGWGGRGIGIGGWGRGGRGGRGGGTRGAGRGEREVDLEEMMDDVQMFRAEWNIWAYYYGEVDPFPGRDPALTSFHFTNSRRDEHHVPNYAFRSSTTQHRDIGPELRGNTSGDQDREAWSREKGALAIEHRAREAERFMREREERRAARWARKKEAGWVRSEEGEVMGRASEGRGSAGRDREWREREAGKEVDGYGRDGGARRENAADGFAHWLERSIKPPSESRGMEKVYQQLGQDYGVRAMEQEQRADSYGQTDNEHRQSADNNNGQEKRKNGGLGSRSRRREKRKTRQTDGEFADSLRSLKEQSREKSMSPGREASGGEWRSDRLDARAQEYRERDYMASGREEYVQREPSGWSGRGNGREADYAVKSRDQDLTSGMERSVWGEGDRGRDGRRNDYDRDAGFERAVPRENRKRRRPIEDERSEIDDIRRPPTLRRDDGRRFVEEEAGTARTEEWIQDGGDQVQGGFREDVYQGQMPRYPRHGRIEEIPVGGGRDRGFGVMKDARDSYRDDRERRRKD